MAKKKEKIIKLNLGCGMNKKKGYINVDKYGNPDKKVDLEKFPWPWKTNSVDEIILYHVLEHLGEKSKTYLKIIQELYRICKPNALIYINVPHPRHDNFINDPTHVRIITIAGLELFSKKRCNEWIKNKNSNTPLALYLDVDFDILNPTYILEDELDYQFRSKQISHQQMMQNVKKYNTFNWKWWS